MKKSLFVVISCLVLYSCVSDITDTVEKVQNVKSVEWNPTIAVPLVYSKLAFRDILDEVEGVKFLEIDSDGSLKLVYADEYFSQTAEEVIELENLNYNETFTLSSAEIDTLNSSGSVTLIYERELLFMPRQNEIDQIRYKAGELVMNMTSTLDHEIDFTLRVLEASQNGNMFGPTVNSASFPHNVTSRTDLDGLDVDFTKGTLGHSQMKAEIEITITKGNAAVKPIETVSFVAEFENPEFQFISGLFDTQNFSSTSGSLGLSLFDNSPEGMLTLADPRINLTFSNSLGFPIKASIDRFEGTNTNNNKVAFLGFPDSLPIPILSQSEIGQVKKDSISFNKRNSNLGDFISNRPYNIEYDVSVNSPSGSVSRQWALDTSKLGVSVEVEIPFYGTARGFVVENSEVFDFELESTEGLKEVLMRLYTENGFPVDVATQVYFEDSVGNVLIDSLFGSDNLILSAGQVDGNGRVISPNPKTTDVVIDNDRIERILGANRVRIVAYFNTPFENGTQPDVKFFDDYDVLIQFGVQAEVLIEQDL